MTWTRSLFRDFGDQLLTVLLALAICAFLLASFWLAEDYHLNEIWVFVGWNSLALLPIFLKKFHGNLKKPAVKLFLLAWMLIHGLYMVALMRWVPIWYWPIFVPLELMAGFWAAYSLFGIMPDNAIDVDKWGSK